MTLDPPQGTLPPQPSPIRPAGRVMRRSDASAHRERRAGRAVRWAAGLLVVGPALAAAQNINAPRQREFALRREWSEAVMRIMEGQPFDAVLADVQAALVEAGDTKSSNEIRHYAESIIRAAKEAPDIAPPYNELDDEALVRALIDSRAVNIQIQDWSLMVRPLHMHRRADGSRQVHWVDLAEPPAYEMTDPAILIMKRGRRIIPLLLTALEDETATRSGYVPRIANQTAVLYRRCDFAMALIEAVSRCRFYEQGTSIRAFSELAPAKRAAAVALARQWWQETEHLSDLDARAWLLDRIPYTQAEDMINVLLNDGQIDMAIKYLSRYMLDDSGKLNVRVARRVAALGVRTPLDHITQRDPDDPNPTRDELEILVDYGGHAEYVFLRNLLVRDKAPTAKGAGQISRLILNVLAGTENRMAIPLFAELLDVDDPMRETVQPSARNMMADSRADIAAMNIQRLTTRGDTFRYDPRSSIDSRKKAIERIRQWWQREGRGLYGLDASRVHRLGGIR